MLSDEQLRRMKTLAEAATDLSGDHGIAEENMAEMVAINADFFLACLESVPAMVEEIQTSRVVFKREG